VTKSPILQYPDFHKQFVVTVDASKLGCGAVLSRLNEFLRNYINVQLNDWDISYI
jgi:hypothetical protein